MEKVQKEIYSKIVQVDKKNWDALFLASKQLLSEIDQKDLKKALRGPRFYELYHKKFWTTPRADFNKEAESLAKELDKQLFELSQNLAKQKKEIREEIVDTQSLYSKVREYSKSVDRFLNRDIIMTIVEPSGDVQFLNSKKTDIFYQQKTGSVKWKVSEKTDFSGLKELETKTGEIAKVVNILDDRISALKSVYAKTLERQNNYLVNSEKKVQYYHTSLPVIQDISPKIRKNKTNSILEGSYIEARKANTYLLLRGSGGEFSEGYIKWILDYENQSSLKRELTEQNIFYFWKHYVAGRKDSVSAIIQGDARLKEVFSGSTIEFAVKGGRLGQRKDKKTGQLVKTNTIGFSLERPYQYIRFATNILNIGDSIFQDNSEIKKFTKETVEKLQHFIYSPNELNEIKESILREII